MGIVQHSTISTDPNNSLTAHERDDVMRPACEVQENLSVLVEKEGAAEFNGYHRVASAMPLDFVVISD